MAAKLIISSEQGPVPVACRETLTIGRVKPNDVVIPDARVSRNHAMVRMLADGRFYVIDVGSANGTFVNGQRIHIPRKLQHGDQIRVGSHTIAFEDEAAQPATAPDTTLETLDHTVLTMGGVLAQLTVLVVDVRGSTTLSEQVAPQKLASIMGSLFNDATRAVQAQGGIVDKFIGDAVMARWDIQEKNAGATVVGAMRAAHEIHRSLQKLNATCEGLPCPIRIGGGINSGAALVGSITRTEYTALGDAINLAFRFESASKELRTDMVVGCESCRHLPQRVWEGRLTEIAIKGKAAPQQVWPLTFAELESVLATLDAVPQSGRA